MKTFLALALLLVSLGTLAGCSDRAQSQNSKAATTRQVSFEAVNEVETRAVHYCNARTLQNKPCRRRVKTEGQRCPLHQGREAIPEDYNYKAKGEK